VKAGCRAAADNAVGLPKSRFASVGKKPRLASSGDSQPAYFQTRQGRNQTDIGVVFAIATIILLLVVPMLAMVKGYAGLARMCRPACSARGSSAVCTQAIE
jgi:hypothetical protein